MHEWCMLIHIIQEITACIWAHLWAFHHGNQFALRCNVDKLVIESNSHMLDNILTENNLSKKRTKYRQRNSNEQALEENHNTQQNKTERNALKKGA